MISNLTPSEVAYAMAVLIQTVVAILWWVGGRVFGDTQRVTTNWAASAAWGAAAFAFYLASWRIPVVPYGTGLRIVGNVLAVLWLVALQRGVWLFQKQPLRYRGHMLALAALLPGAWLGLFDANNALRIVAHTGVQVCLGLAIAIDLHACARTRLKWRYPSLLAVPILAFCVLTAARGLQAAFTPVDSMSQFTGNSGLNVVTAFVCVLLLLPLNGVLLTLVVTQLRADLLRLSHHDGLTGLLNRRALQESLTAQLQRSRRNGERFCVLMLDVDHFKRINDRFGHAVGDAALQHLSALLGGQLRTVDRLARFGGEEFLVLLPGVVLSDAVRLGERLRALVAGAPLQYAGAAIPLSVSIGIAEWSGALEDTSRLLVRVDAALYQAKHQGRNQVVTAGDEVLISAPQALAT